NEVVIDDEYLVPPAELPQRIELRNHLGRRFRPRAAPIDCYDVAELALEWAPARELNGYRRVLIELQQIETRNRATCHVRLVQHAIQIARGALFERGGDTGPNFFRLSGKHMIRLSKDRLRITADPRASNERPASERAGPRENRQRIESLRVHRADHHQADTQQVTGAQLAACTIDEAYAQRSEAKRGKCDEAQRRRHRALR